MLSHEPTLPDARPQGHSEQPVLFSSFLMGGFEGSSHRRADGRQLDLIAATRHDERAPAWCMDWYKQLQWFRERQKRIWN